MSHELRAVILDGYRRSNAGDGLLVDEAIKLVREAVPGVDVRLVSMDPSGFPEYPNGLHPVSGPRGRMTPRDLLMRLFTGRPHRDVADAIADADIAVAVGGGYLRAGNVSAGLKSFLSHMVQAPTAKTRTPYVYLPQSVGPLPPRWIPYGVWRLDRAEAFFVRDDRSAAELGRFGVSTIRMPDLAVVALAAAPDPLRRDAARGRVGLVARALDRRQSAYRGRLEELHRLLDPEILVQSRGAGNDDPAFYQSMAWEGTHRSLVSAVEASVTPAVVVSVRLHGALQSILSGVPSVHLSYERKGWGAYEDLGLSEYVHNAWSFDPARVAAQVKELSADARSYWARIDERLPGISAQRARIVAAIHDAAYRKSASSLHTAAS